MFKSAVIRAYVGVYGKKDRRGFYKPRLKLTHKDLVREYNYHIISFY